MKYFKTLRQSRLVLGFNLTELMTATAIVGILSTVGISSYKAQQDKARAAEAKYSLSSVFSSEQQFRSNWGTYHENLVLVQAVPVGSQHYDVGFKTAPHTVRNFPADPYATQVKCNNWYEICNGDCANAIPTYLKSSYFRCSIDSTKRVKDYTGSDASSYEATDTAFKAMARGELDAEDMWHINQEQTLIREKDGSN